MHLQQRSQFALRKDQESFDSMPAHPGGRLVWHRKGVRPYTPGPRDDEMSNIRDLGVPAALELIRRAKGNLDEKRVDGPLSPREDSRYLHLGALEEKLLTR